MKAIILTIAAIALSVFDATADPPENKGGNADKKPPITGDSTVESAASAKTGGEKDSGGTKEKGKEDARGEKIFGLLDTEHVQIDLRAIEASKGEFGIEYKFHFEKNLKPDTEGASAPLERTWKASLKGEGFLVTDPAKNQLDSITTEAALKFDPLWILERPAHVPASGNIWSTGTGSERKLGSDISDGRNRAPQLQSPLWIYAKASIKWETTQDGKDQDLAVGASMAATTSFLNPILDAPFKVLRFGQQNNNNARHLDVSAGYDYVTARKVSGAGSGNDKNRIAVRAEWETGIFKNDRIAFVFNGHYDIDGSDRGFHPFFEAKYLRLLLDKPGAKTSFAIKYTVGELAPTYKQGNIIGAGFSIDFN